MAGVRYLKAFDEQAYKLALLGATNDSLADFFGVATSTIKKWRKRHKGFDAALKSGKEDADATVAKCLFKRATGYQTNEVHISNYKGEITLTPYVKNHPPDTTAMIFWLKNRRPDLWRDKPNPDEDDGKTVPLNITFNVSEPAGPIRVTNGTKSK